MVSVFLKGGFLSILGRIQEYKRTRRTMFQINNDVDILGPFTSCLLLKL